MTEKVLGKIKFAEFGKVPDYPFLTGLQLVFSLNGGGSSIGNPNVTIDIEKILNDAKVNYVSELKGKPVEVEIENNRFKSFRILTEVL